MMKQRASGPWGVEVVILAMALFALAGCASGRRTLSAAPGNTALGDHNPDGSTVLRSEKKHTVFVRPISPRFSNELRDMPSFAVMVTNGGTQNLPFGPNNVAVTSDGALVTMLDAAETKRRMMQEMGLQRRTGTINVHDATQSGESVYRYPEGASERMNVPNMSVRDPTDPRQQELSLPAMPVPSRLLSEVLQARPIRPGAVGGGYITLEAREIAADAPLRITVTVGGETHTFLFDVNK